MPFTSSNPALVRGRLRTNSSSARSLQTMYGAWPAECAVSLRHDRRRSYATRSRSSSSASSSRKTSFSALLCGASSRPRGCSSASSPPRSLRQVRQSDQYGIPPCTKAKESAARISRPTAKSRSRSFWNPCSRGSNANVRTVTSMLMTRNTVEKSRARCVRSKRAQRLPTSPSQARLRSGAGLAFGLVLRTLPAPPLRLARPIQGKEGKRTQGKIRASSIGLRRTRGGCRACSCGARQPACSRRRR